MAKSPETTLSALEPGDPGFGRRWREAFFLEPSALHLNHGSYGAVPRAVMAAQNGFRERAERLGSTFHRETYGQLLADSTKCLAGALGGDAADWVFAENATAACNAVIASQDFRAGDEVLITSGIYGAVRKALRHWLDGRGVRLVEVPVVLPVEAPEQIVAAVGAALTPRTRLAVFDHIVSASALLLPVAELCALCRANGTPSLIDGAHAPGQVALDVPGLGADYYTGNAHKWLFAPKGCAMLWARAERQQGLHPTVISHGLGGGWQAEFGWIGTRDSSAWFTLPAAVAAHEGFGGARLMARNRALAAEAGRMLAGALRTEVAGPPDMQCAMVTVRLPVARRIETEAAQVDFGKRYGMEVSFVPWNGGTGVRLSAQVYNEMAEYERLLPALREFFGI